MSPVTILCRSCHEPVPPALIIGAVANCPACGEVFEIELTLPPDTPRSLPPPPTYVVARTHGSALELVMPWKYSEHSVEGPILLIPLVLGLTSSVATFNPLWTLLGLPFAYIVLCRQVNSTTVLIAPGGVDVAHGPLPTLYQSGVYRAPDLQGLGRETKRVHRFARNRHEKVTHITYAHLRARGGYLLKWWPEEESVRYAQECIRTIVKR